ncbi:MULTISPECIES: hypothetical protein [unclassified Salinivibrio]|uniref:hypothetical protein n=1 Tax=unclassified Salinivibrio TaxID=2636825 RepID=UPI00128C455B|nr:MULTISPECIES: hypothetical protein [unclassified Salinivibrio]MPS31010.1 hypothetical protein [Salinivibrio sp. VYel7]MPX92411.1 hypothetical protein [Salinivibrio sp. VYel9]MPX97679.1 hypothetical protein [Salinivibrio sp. VYel6]MPX98643.1 hypothetical protein [Salinivibrio sp. VYel4]MPY01656.1 hypothetical protein [Salinivibrio sp. VYel5]
MAIQEFLNHLEFFGYSSSQDEDGDWHLTGGASAPVNFFINERANGINLRAGYGLEGTTFDEVAANAINAQLWLSKVTIVKEHELAVLEAWTPAVYSKAGFGVFFDRFKSEVQIFTEALVGSIADEE